MTADEFIANWKGKEITERQGSQSHFNDLCGVIGHAKPTDSDPASFTFEKHVRKELGGKGFADVWMKGCFGWEYKGDHADLVEAYHQLQQYRQDLGNPRLLVVCDMNKFIIHTAFNDTTHQQTEILLEELAIPDKLDILRSVFFDPDKLRPGYVEKPITEDAATHIAQIAESVRARGVNPKDVAHFLDRIVFCLFAQNIGLLPRGMFTEIVKASTGDAKIFSQYVGELFAAMASGSKNVLLRRILHFNGNLFDGSPVLELTLEEIKAIETAAALDWRKVDASIFGTLFERGLDPTKRAQLGAHYTSREDIETIVEPTVIQPLRRDWDSTREAAEKMLAGDAKKSRAKAEGVILGFLERLRKVRVLDPAGGSGNFLYVSLQKLLDLEREVNDYLAKSGFTPQFPQVNPLQLYCIELNAYAHDLAQMTVLIGYIQWLNAHGYGFPAEPILQRLDQNFFCKDAILDLSDPANPKESTWPAVDFIVSNPPFLGDKMMRGELGDEYVETIRQIFKGRVPGGADLCCYWFEKARVQLEDEKCKRAGLLATQGIRGGKNREVLKHIKETGDIFFAVSDRPWILDGANVHVSMVGFDNGTEKERILDGQSVPTINPNLTKTADITESGCLSSQTGIGFIGVSQHGPFEISEEVALTMLNAPNPHGYPNSDVVRPILNAMEITRRAEKRWVVYYPVEMSETEAALYEKPFDYVLRVVKPVREQNHRASYRDRWWLHGESRPAMVKALAGCLLILATPRVSKHRVFIRMPPVVLPSDACVAFARADDYFFGVLHSRAHEVWARAQGTQLREKESGFRYTPTSCFETFPFPEPVTAAQQAGISGTAKELDSLRTNWLNPPEWMREEAIEFPARADGPWSRYVKDGVARYPRLMPKDADCAKNLAKRTLTNLYNERPTWLANIHHALDEAVYAAYGWPTNLSDEQVLEGLLALNQERSKNDVAKPRGHRDATPKVAGGAVQLVGIAQPPKPKK